MVDLNCIVYFYRIREWKNKNTWLKSLMYTFLGYLVAGNFNFVLMSINTLVISGIFMCIFAMNNLFDSKLGNENNFIGTLIKRGLSYKRALVYCFVPLLTLPLILFTNTTSAFLALIFLLLGALYSLPSLRIKEKGYGWLINTFCAGIVFLQAYFALGARMNPTTLMLLIVILLFHTYIEGFHILVDYKIGETRIERKKMMKTLNSLPFISLVTSLLFSIFNPIFLVTSFFSLVRLNALRNVGSVDICKIRFSAVRPFTSTLYSSYEFAIYGLCFLVY